MRINDTRAQSVHLLEKSGSIFLTKVNGGEFEIFCDSFLNTLQFP